MYCPKCGKQVADGAAFCGSCGHQMGGAQQQPAPPQQYAQPPQYPQQPASYGAEQPRKGGSSCWIIGCIALALVLLVGGVGVYFVARNAKDGQLNWRWQWPPGGQQMSADEQAVRGVVEDFYAAWADGDLAAAQALSTESYAATLYPDGFGSGYVQHSLTIVSATRIDQDHWQVVADEVFDNLQDGQTTDRSTIEVVNVGGGWLVDGWAVETVQETTGQTQAVRDEQMSIGRISGSPVNSVGQSYTSGGSSGQSQTTGGNPGSGGTQSGGDIPSPMQRLNDFLAAAGGTDGSLMLPFMTPQLQSDFAQTAEIWGQGDFDHVGWQVNEQTRASDTQWSFQVTQTCKDWADGTLFHDNYNVSMVWSGTQWQVSRFEMTGR